MIKLLCQLTITGPFYHTVRGFRLFQLNTKESNTKLSMLSSLKHDIAKTICAKPGSQIYTVSDRAFKEKLPDPLVRKELKETTEIRLTENLAHPEYMRLTVALKP